MNNEIWLNVNNEYHDYYMVSNFGNVKKLQRKIYKNHTGNTTSVEDQPEKLVRQHVYSGYSKVFLYCKNVSTKTKCFSVHRLVMEAFNPIKDMEKLQVNHLDGNKENNNVENVDWRC